MQGVCVELNRWRTVLNQHFSVMVSKAWLKLTQAPVLLFKKLRGNPACVCLESGGVIVLIFLRATPSDEENALANQIKYTNQKSVSIWCQRSTIAQNLSSDLTRSRRKSTKKVQDFHHTALYWRKLYQFHSCLLY